MMMEKMILDGKIYIRSSKHSEWEEVTEDMLRYINKKTVRLDGTFPCPECGARRVHYFECSLRAVGDMGY